MRAVPALIALASAAAGLASAADHRNTTTSTSDAAPRRYIVELRDRAAGARAAQRVQSGAVPGLRVVKHFDSEVFPAVSVECEAADDDECDGEEGLARKFGRQDDDGVARVYKSRMVRLVSPYAEGETFADDAAAKEYDVHGSTGVDRLHELGILGEGATVAIVDSGVQYTHPALGGCIGPDCTVIGGYDLVGDGDWPDAPPEPDNDPMDHYGHGTHVAGIVAGKSDQFVGVAPGAKILSYKVFTSSGFSNEETVIEGFLKAFDSGADIISASLGETSGFTSNAWAVVATRMVERGVFVAIAAGNDGQDGPFLGSNGASGKDVLTVASGEPSAYPAQSFTATFGGSNATEIAYVPATDAFPASVSDWPIVPLTLNTSVEADACDTLPEDTEDLSEQVVLVRVGGCGVSQKFDNLAEFNATYILFYNDGGAYVDPSTGRTTGLTGAIEARAGEAIVEAILDGDKVTASFDTFTGHYVGLQNSGAGRPALYSSFGGTYDLALKPDVTAPGSKILSTYPTDSYKILSGTSMATPYMAGIAALWVGKNGGRAKLDAGWAKALVSRITATAHTVAWADWTTSEKDYGFWAPTVQVGAGYVDAQKMMDYVTEVGFEGRKFELNDTAHFAGTHTVELTNTGDQEVTYEFELQDAAGFDAWIPGEDEFYVPRIRWYNELEPVQMTPEVDMPGALKLGPGESGTAEFTFTAPTGLNATNLPVYSGKVLISGSNGEELGVPYFGVGCDLKETITHVWDYGANYPYLYKGYSGQRLDANEPANFTFNLTREEQDFPHLNTQLVWGSEELRWDIFDASYTEADWAYPPVVGEKGYVGAATSWNDTVSSGWFTPGENSEDDIFSFPLYDVPRNDWGIYYWLGRFANGSQIQPGEYKWRIAVLKPFGDRQVAEDWDIWATPEITVLPM
ncbi:peptidase S8/S53 domain-containing protein [Xylariomycetidae sp. FL0641]|nr:peptidase S8/S53 domain-containing protein [Xylariomycetidae sp. FL0641]